MDALVGFVWLIVIGSSIWVVVDGIRLGVRRGVIGDGHWADVGVTVWFFLCLVLWIFGFPAYLATRPKYVALRQQFPTGTIPLAVDRANAGWQARIPAAPAQAPTASGTDVTEQLRRIGELRDSGVLTPEEFEAKKRQLLDRL